jgi:large subunit ribosomal protein L29
MKTTEELYRELEMLLKSHLSMRVRIAMQQFPNTSLLSKTRKDIARVRTILSQRRITK